MEWRTDYDVATRKRSTKESRCFSILERKIVSTANVSTLLLSKILRSLAAQRKLCTAEGGCQPGALPYPQVLRIQAFPTIILAGSDGKIPTPGSRVIWTPAGCRTPASGHREQAPDGMSSRLSGSDQIDQRQRLHDGGGSQEDHHRRKRSVDSDQGRETLHEVESHGRPARPPRQMHDKGQSLEAVDTLTDLLKRYAGTEAAEEGSRLLALLADKPDIRTKQRLGAAPRSCSLRPKTTSNMGNI